MTGIKNIIFDLGGVILNIDFRKTEQAFHDLGVEDFSKHITQFHITPLFQDYETGKIDDTTFIKGIQALSHRPITEAEVIIAWNALLLDFPEERINLLKKLRNKYRLFLLSNTNAIHLVEFQRRFHDLTGGYLEAIFEKTYYSHAVGMRKPNEEIYQLVVNENKLVPAETLFVDDTAANFPGSEKIGLRSAHVVAPKTILDLGLI
jgi:glucose-1-phosphatase